MAVEWLYILRLAEGGQTPLTFAQMAIHDAITVRRAIAIRQAQGVAHLMHEGRQQIHAASRHRAWLGVATGRGFDCAEESVARGTGVHEPSATASVGIHANRVSASFTEAIAIQGGDFKLHRLQTRHLLAVEAGRLPARDGGSDHGSKFRLGNGSGLASDRGFGLANGFHQGGCFHHGSRR